MLRSLTIKPLYPSRSTRVIVKNILNKIYSLFNVKFGIVAFFLSFFFGTPSDIRPRTSTELIGELIALYASISLILYLSKPTFIFLKKIRRPYQLRLLLPLLAIALLLGIYMRSHNLNNWFYSFLDKFVYLLAGLIALRLIFYLLKGGLLIFRTYKSGRFINRYLLISNLISVIFLGLLVFMFYQNEAVSARLHVVENRLGGTTKLACDESKTIETVKKSVVRIVGGEGEGSGFIINSDGDIVTNFHVIQFEPSPKVVYPDNTFDTAQIIVADKNADIAILKAKTGYPNLNWGKSDDLQVGEDVITVGFPFGSNLPGEATVTKGSVSRRIVNKELNIDYIVSDAQINPGNSGGPMVNICGLVEGINTATLSGLSMALSSTAAQSRWWNMLSTNTNGLQDIQKITFNPNNSPTDAVSSFYNYLKLRKMENAWGLLSDNFKKGYSFDYWVKGYQNLLDNTLIKIEPDKQNDKLVKIKLATKNMTDDQITTKYFEGTWEVHKIGDNYMLWDANIKEVKNPDYSWFY